MTCSALAGEGLRLQASSMRSSLAQMAAVSRASDFLFLLRLSEESSDDPELCLRLVCLRGLLEDDLLRLCLSLERERRSLDRERLLGERRLRW